MPFPAGEDDDEDDKEGGEDGDRRGRGNPGQGKGLSREQKEGLDMIKHVMLSLDEEDGLDQIYTFRCFFLNFIIIIIIFYNKTSLTFVYVYLFFL